MYPGEGAWATGPTAVTVSEGRIDLTPACSSASGQRAGTEVAVLATSGIASGSSTRSRRGDWSGLRGERGLFSLGRAQGIGTSEGGGMFIQTRGR